ncbi:MAG: dienelactone hydrolase family protein [Beijerinckiaceae bacterium]|nr:dienelactone hydrolase family protein [Beijerinckiaceae bacterium]
MLRRFLVLLCLVFSSHAPFAATPFSAGILRVQVAAEIPFDVFALYPTREAESPFEAGPYTIAARRDAVPAEGRFPVVLLSHGSGGSPFAHRDLASHLARAGFIVVAPVHVGDAAGRTGRRDAGLAPTDRPGQAVQALEAVLKDPRLADRADSARMGAIGYSAGGYTALVLAGATPDFARWPAYCRQSPGNSVLCSQVTETRHPGAGAGAWQPPREPRLKALVLIAPLAMPFGPEGLATLRLPIQLHEATGDTIVPSASNGDTLMRAILPVPQRRRVAGGHHIFIDPCPPAAMARLAELCTDPPGVDRAAIHAALRDQVTAFLRSQLE